MHNLERCLTVYGGNCQSSQSSCSGSSYTHDSSFYRLCQQSTDSCCITSMPGRATTTPSPTLPPATSVTTGIPIKKQVFQDGNSIINVSVYTL